MEAPEEDEFADEMQHFVLPDESAATFLARSHVEPFWTSVPFLDREALQAGHVLEIHGASGSGKTQALLQIAVTCILPKQWEKVVYGGLGGAVFFFDLDCRVDVLRLLQLLHTRINGARRAQGYPPFSFGEAKSFSTGEQNFSKGQLSFHAAGSPGYHPLVLSCLERFHLLRCHSSFQFLAALKTVRPIFRRLDSDILSKTQLVLIDSISAYYWMDRAARTSTTPAPAAGPRNDSGRQNFMPAVWQDYVTHRVLLEVLASTPKGINSVQVFQAEWQLPPSNSIEQFTIEPDGIFTFRQRGDQTDRHR